MGYPSNSDRTALAQELAQLGPITVTATLGFDACIDTIARLVRFRHADGALEFFAQISEFGDFLQARNNKSAGLDLATQATKIGGNMAIMAHALGQLEVGCTCLGTFGHPSPENLFQQMSPLCKRISVGPTVHTTALEFDNGKLMLCDLGPYAELSWERLREQFSSADWQLYFAEKNLLALLNWSELPHSTAIWQGLLAEVFPRLPPFLPGSFMLVDLSDCTRYPAPALREALETLLKFQHHLPVVLSMNRHESELVAQALDVAESSHNATRLEQLGQVLPLDGLLLHGAHEALAWTQTEGIQQYPGFFVANPTLLTGGGDHFNAGYAFARLQGWRSDLALLCGNAVGGYYVKNGHSPSRRQLFDFLTSEPD